MCNSAGPGIPLHRYHYANTSMQYTAIFHGCKKRQFSVEFIFDIFYIFAQNIDCGYSLEPSEAVLTSTHNLCFRAKIRKNEYPCKPQFYCIKVGCKGVYITRKCLHDVSETGPSLFTFL